METIDGRCLCSAIKFKVKDAFKYVLYCHCSECRRFSGSIFSVTGGIVPEDLEITEGADQIRRYEKTANSTMCFCGRCGSSLFVEKPTRHLIHVRFGVLDRMPSAKPQAHVFVASKVPWYDIADKLPQFPELPVRA